MMRATTGTAATAGMRMATGATCTTTAAATVATMGTTTIATTVPLPLALPCWGAMVPMKTNCSCDCAARLCETSAAPTTTPMPGGAWQ
eukprot:2946258-Pyramimonas_sp.AAC.1